MWWRRCTGVFFYFFLFLFYQSFCCLCGSVEQREHVLPWQDYASRIMQETCQGPKQVVVTVDGVSISITVETTIVRTMQKKMTENTVQTQKKSSRYHIQQSTDKCTFKRRTDLTCRHSESQLQAARTRPPSDQQDIVSGCNAGVIAGVIQLA